MHTVLQKYFEQRVKNAFNYLHDFEIKGDEVSLHDFRVEMKKLKSILKFLKKIYPKQKLKKASHLLSFIFQSAGEIREYQIIQQWLQKNNHAVVERYFFPPEQLSKLIRHFQMNAGEYKSNLKRALELMEKYVASTNQILCEQYVVELEARLEKMMHKHLSSSQWHELRKLIKQWMYALNWLPRKEPYDKYFPYYNKLQETIGQWHDLEFIKELFSQKQIYLSQDIEIQKDFTRAWETLLISYKQKSKQIEEMLSKACEVVQKTT
jgi:CHAD domain-containing protein